MIGTIASAVAGPLMGLVDDLFTSDEERAEAKRKLVELEQKGRLAEIAGQMQVNLQEAKSDNLFVAGWRPAVGWICGVALGYNFILQPFALFAATVGGIDPAILATLPALDMAQMMPILLGMLGLAGARTFEKTKRADKAR